MENEQPNVAQRTSIAGLMGRFFGPLAVFIQILRVASTGLGILFLIPWSADLSFPEGAVVARAWDVTRGETPYHDWREWPHSFAPYGPLTYYPVGLAGRLLQLQDHPKILYTVGRIQSVVALIGIAGLLWGIARRIGMTRVWGFLCVAVFMAWQRPLVFATSYRPDAPQIFFSLLALWIALGGEVTARRTFAALLALSISMWFKPVSIGMAAALAVWIASSDGWKRMILAMALFAGVNLGAATALHFLWERRLFLNMIGSLDNGFEPINVVLFIQFLGFVPRLIFIAGIVHATAFLLGSERNTPPRLLMVAALFTLLVSTLQGLKTGADVNYYLECHALLSISAVWWASRLWREAMTGGLKFRVATLCAFFLFLAVMDGYLGLRTIRRDLRNIREGWQTLKISQRMQSVQGEVLVEVPFLALQRPSPPTIMDRVQYAILVERGKIDERALLDKVARREFTMMVAAPPALGGSDPWWFGRNFRAALLREYHPVESQDGLTILGPAGK